MNKILSLRYVYHVSKTLWIYILLPSTHALQMSSFNSPVNLVVDTAGGKEAEGVW